jgi:predicted RNA-binding protein with PUA-like domain
MKKGDHALFYHSNEFMVTGTAEIVKEHYPDPTASENIWSAVDIKPHKSFKKPVTLDQIKSDNRLKNMLLLKIGRLSIMPVAADEFNIIEKAGS